LRPSVPWRDAAVLVCCAAAKWGEGRYAAPQADGGFGAIATMDGRRGLGQAVAHAAMSKAIALSKEHGIGAVAVRNSGHFGTALYFTKIAAEAGCVGFVSTNASPAMAPWRRLRKTRRHESLVMGRPCRSIRADDVGYCKHCSHFGSAVVGPYVPDGVSGVGHFVMAINIKACRPLADFNVDMEHLIDALKVTQRQPRVHDIYYPGELEALSDIKLRKNGIDLPQDTSDDLRNRAREFGVIAPF
jgi:LDH2 family malate/lactate/ureidoglycolate dehydrogenase